MRPPVAALRRLRMALAGVALCVTSPLAWWASADLPWLRATTVAAFAVAATGVALGLAAALRGGGGVTWTLLALDLLLVAALVWGVLGFAALPAAERARELERAPDFALEDHLGRGVRLSDELARGPVLLVFYRGFW